MNYEEYKKTVKPKTDICVCPDCGSKVTYYHDYFCTRIVCSNNCNGYKPFMIIQHRK